MNNLRWQQYDVKDVKKIPVDNNLSILAQLQCSTQATILGLVNYVRVLLVVNHIFFPYLSFHFCFMLLFNFIFLTDDILQTFCMFIKKECPHYYNYVFSHSTRVICS